MPPLTPPRARRFARPGVYLGIATVLLLISALAIEEARSFEARFHAQRVATVSEKHAQQFEFTESRIMAERLQPVFSELARTDDIGALETRARRDPLIDAIYLWDRDELVFPPPAIEADVSALRREACMRTPAGAGGDAVKVAAAHARCYRSENPQLALFALSESVEMLLDQEQSSVATEHLSSVARLHSRSLTQARQLGLDVRVLAGVQLQAARAMHAAGRSEIAQNWVVDLAKDISRLDGPELDRALDLTNFPIPQDLRAYGGPGPELPDDAEERVRRAHRRRDAWRELDGESIATPNTPGPGEFPRVIVDPLDDPPWLVYVSRLGIGELYGAVQVDQTELVREVLAGARSRHLSIREANGRVLAGSPDELLFEVPFPRLLPHLRVGLSTAAIAGDSASAGTLVRRFGPFAAAICIGLVALGALIRNDRQQELLLERQRDFVARVSHELKTPLAGIRLMAENLEIGAFRDDAQREAFARRIVQEADRLTARVNEVIRAATRPEDAVPAETDVDAMMAELVTAWQPRLQAAGAQLIVELQPCGRVKLMSLLVRDALNNLLDNALKYRKGDVGGRVWLRARRQGRVVIFEVEDDGLGVPTSLRKSIFERFRRVEGGGRGKAGGHGLGLSFVAETARLHGGKVECGDGVAGGAKFILRIRGRG